MNSKDSNTLRFYRRPPTEKNVYPRDGERAERSSDLLFVAMVMQTMQSIGGRLTLFSHPTNKKIRGYRVHAADGRYLHPVTGSELPPDEKHVVKMELKLPSLRAHLRDEGYGFRRLIRSGAHDLEISGDEGVLDRHRIPNGEQPAADPFLDNLHLAKLLDFAQPIKVKRGQLICPLDGPVAPGEVTLRSPPSTWTRLCGREWVVTFCPQCLFQFQDALVQMN